MFLLDLLCQFPFRIAIVSYKFPGSIQRPVCAGLCLGLFDSADCAPRGLLTAPSVLFTSGCFWGVELAYQRVPGVLETEVGYIDGQKKNPTYQEVCSGTTGHTEALRVNFDPRIGE